VSTEVFVRGDHGAAVAADFVRIVLVDEQAIFRDGLRRLLETQPGLRVVAEARDPHEAVEAVSALRPDILILSFGASASYALDELEQVIASGASGANGTNGTPVRTILLTGAIDTLEVMTAAIQLGACGVVPKDCGPEVLFKSIESVMEGSYWVGRECVSDVPASVRKLETTRRQTKAFGLTRRELEILRSVLSGETNREIARGFAISENTVKRHLSHIFDKVGASNRVELARFASHHRLLEGF
jgi:two-component system, NarL family, nitrate/nitrite response regulator NarL